MSAMMDLLAVSGNWIWPGGRVPLLVTNHGSHLYGTAIASSDRDIYCVLTGLPTRPTQSRAAWTYKRQANGVDITMIDFGTWINECQRGVPQALEAMFAPGPDTDRIGALRAGYRTGTAAWPTYLRTIKAFAYSDTDDHRANKRKVHALRLSWNLYQMRVHHGRFNPVLHPQQVEMYRRVVEQFDGDDDGLYDVCLKVAWK